jgi:N-acetylglutamate synthase-like GNAT family acetyltransferase
MTGVEGQPVLRLAHDADARAITELVADAYRHYEPLLGRTPLPMLVHYEDAVREHDVWVLDADGSLVGVLEVEPRPDHLWIENVAVAPAWQGRGLGRLLLRHAESEARRSGLAELGLLTNERYAADIAMYVRYGYVETDRVPYQGSDLVYFRKRLDASEPEPIS